MGRINVLSKQLANMIAAGEVVERPSSVVKELAENAVDAGATDIAVEIKNGGSAYIRVTDNGCGMSKDDAVLAFSRHATSKIKDENDLVGIQTMGFRGEALAAISAVSVTEMVTCERGSEAATLVTVNGGEVSKPEEIGAPEGTTVVVKDLFFNTPARKKFLKKDVTESAAIVSLVEKMAFAMPDISFSLIKDGRPCLQTDGRGIKSAVESIYEADIYKNLLYVNYELDGVSVTGYVGKPEISRQNRNMQHFSVNGRVIRSRVFQTAVEEAYKNRLMTKNYPVCIINITADFSKIDVNVHPSKLEVKIYNEKTVYDAVYFAVMSALDNDSTRKEIAAPARVYNRFEGERPVEKQVQIPLYETRKAPAPISTRLEDWGYKDVIKTSADKTVSATQLNSPTADEIDRVIAAAIKTRTEAAQAEKEHNTVTEQTLAYRYVGEVFKTYLIVETEKEVLLIDKHAAQERILFEKLKAHQKKPDCQSLIAPVVYRATNEEYAALLDNLALVKELGFDVDDFGTGSIAIRGIPADLAMEDPAALLSEVVTAILEGKRDKKPAEYDELLHSMACKAAIKGGQHNTTEELSAFVDKLMAMPEIRYCPHGRPIILSLSKSFFEGQFKR